MTKTTKGVFPSNELIVDIVGTKITLIKNSNTYKIGEELRYLKQIIWEEQTDSILKEIEEQLKK